MLLVFDDTRLIGDVVAAEVAVQRGTELLLELLQAIRCISNGQTIAGQDRYRWQLRDGQALASLDAIHTHLVVGQCETLGKRQATGRAGIVDVEHRVEDAR